MGSVAENMKELLGPQVEALAREIGSAIMRGILHEEEKGLEEKIDPDSETTIDPFCREYREKFAEIFRAHRFAGNQEAFIKSVVSLLCEAGLCKTIQTGGLLGRGGTHYTLTDTGHNITRAWFKKNGSGIDPRLARDSKKDS